MRILFLSQWFQPEPFFKGLPFVNALLERGHHVEVLTGFPNYPGGKVYPGYRVRLYQGETMDGVKIHRVALYPSHDKSALHRIVNYLSFSLSALILGPWLIDKPDVIYVYNLVTLGFPAFLMRLLFGSKVIIDVQDLWPESVVNSKMLNNRFCLNFLDSICRWIYRKADKLVVLSPGFKQMLINRGVSPEKIEIIYNWCDEMSICKAMVPSVLEKGLEFPGEFIVLFAGTMGIAQGLHTILDCAKICGDKLPHVRFVLVGGGIERDKLQQRANEMRLTNVTFLPPKSMDTMGKIFAIADALIVHLKDDPLFRVTIPSKTQAYLYTGKPIIMAVRGNAANLIRKAEAGILCEPENPSDIFNAIEKLCLMSDQERQRMGKSGLDFYKNFLSFATGVDQFEKSMLAMQM